MLDHLEKRIEESIEKINKGFSVEEIYNSLLSELQVNEIFYVLSHAQIRIAKNKNKLV